jgi:hypothetical protein
MILNFAGGGCLVSIKADKRGNLTGVLIPSHRLKNKKGKSKGRTWGFVLKKGEPKVRPYQKLPFEGESV